MRRPEAHIRRARPEEAHTRRRPEERREAHNHPEERRPEAHNHPEERRPEEAHTRRRPEEAHSHPEERRPEEARIHHHPEVRLHLDHPSHHPVLRDLRHPSSLDSLPLRFRVVRTAASYTPYRPYGNSYRSNAQKYALDGGSSLSPARVSVW